MAASAILFFVHMACTNFEYKSKPYIFIGYHNVGYKCLDPVTNKAFLSHHVAFDETSFPTKDQTSSLLPSKINASTNAPFTLLVSMSFPMPNNTSSHPTYSHNSHIDLHSYSTTSSFQNLQY